MKQEQAKEKSVNEQVAESVKVLGPKLVLEVLRKKDNGIVLMDEAKKEYEHFFPVIAVGDQPGSLKVGDYVAVVPGRDYGVIHLYGKEYIVCTVYDVEYAVTAEYASQHDAYEKTREAAKTNIQAELAKAKIDSGIFKDKNSKDLGVKIINRTN